MNGHDPGDGPLPWVRKKVGTFEPFRERASLSIPSLTPEWEAFLFEVRAVLACGDRCDSKRLCSSCMNALEWYRRLALANIPRKYWPHDIEDCIVDDGEAVAFFRHAIAHVDDVVARGLGMSVFGTNGNGKTSLCTYFMRAALRRGFSAYYAHVEALFSLIKASFDDVTLRDRVRAIRSVDVLLLDDLGRENVGRTDFVPATFDDLFRYRDGMGLSTLMTTNLPPATARERYGNALASLWSGSSKIIILRGSDLRPRLNEWDAIE